MKIYLIEKTEYNGAYGTVTYRSTIEAWASKQEAEKAVNRYESKSYKQPTYFGIDELELKGKDI